MAVNLTKPGEVGVLSFDPGRVIYQIDHLVACLQVRLNQHEHPDAVRLFADPVTVKHVFIDNEATARE